MLSAQSTRERSRVKMMDERRRFITVDNYEAVKVGDSEKDSVVLPIVWPIFSLNCPE